jgi:transposase
VPECYIPPSKVLEWRAQLELYHDLRVEHTGWAQRIHATCFHQGATSLGEAGVVRGSRERLDHIVAEQLSPTGRLQVNTALSVMDTLAEHLDRLRRRLVATARHVNGARALMAAIYGVGPMSSLALCAWLGGPARFSSSRKAVRFTGLDITVHSSAGKRSGRSTLKYPTSLRCKRSLIAGSARPNEARLFERLARQDLVRDAEGECGQPEHRDRVRA